MLDLAFKNIRRQRIRTALTILGIIIGIGAIVALGSIAEGIEYMIQSNLELVAGKIMVIEKDSGFFGMMGSLDQEDLETISSVSRIKDVVPVIVHLENIVPMHGPEWIAIGIQPSKSEYFVGKNIEVDGRVIEDGESGVAELGKDLAEKYNVETGDYFSIKDTDFEVVGILEKTGISDIDISIVVPLEDLQDVLETDTFQIIYAIPDDVADTERVAEEIEDVDEKLDAITTKEFARQASQIVDQIRFFTLGVGAIAAIVGGLGVMNTMIMAVIERRKEIGVMKAIGATNNMVLKQILTESAMISLIGGVGGVLLGMIGSFSLVILSGGFITTIVTPALILIGLGFALLLGLLGGLYPAQKAAKLDPVDALRYE
jgi:putative ABC transport system permease protein